MYLKKRNGDWFANTGAVGTTKWKYVYHLKKKTDFFCFIFPSLPRSLIFFWSFFFFTFGVKKRRPEHRIVTTWIFSYNFYFFAFLVMAIFCHLFSWTKAADPYDVVRLFSFFNNDENRFHPISKKRTSFKKYKIK